tara:strand:+ start:8382 stop:9665 length:1284 start_codon:yes stop_codon:yes gene_type:complete
MYVQSYDLCNAGEAKDTKQTLTRGGKIFLAYLFIEYMFPLFMNLMFDTQPIFRLPIDLPDILFKVLLLILVSIIAVLVARFTPTIVPTTKGPIKPLPKWFILMFSLIAILVGYSIFSSGLTQWRYTTSISNSPTVFYASIVQLIMPVMTFWILITDHNLILSRSRSDMLLKGVLLLAIIFSMNGLGSVFITCIFALVLFAPLTILRLFFNNSVKTKKKSFFKNIGLMILLPLVILPIFVGGLFSKSGTIYTFEESALAHLGFNYLVNRHSVHLSQVAASIEDGPNIEDLSIPFGTSIYRIKVLTGIDPEAKKPKISTFSRLALLQFADFQKINPRGGSSPGLLASLTMVLPLPLATLATFLATFILVKILDFILFRQPPFSMIGAIVFAYIPFKLLTDSPIDLLIPGPITIILVSILLLSFRRERFA